MIYNISNVSTVNISSSKVNEELRIIQLVFASILFVAGVAGNVFTIFHIINRSLYKQVCNMYILNLSTNNLITSAITIPILGVSFYKQKWIFGEAFCYIFPYLMHTTLCSETNALLLITINRYCKVVRPELYDKLYSKKYFNVVLISLSWLVYLMIQTLPLAKIWGKFEYNEHKHYCTYTEDSETTTFIVSLCAGILLTNLPVHMFCYGSILWKYNKSKKRMSTIQGRSHRRKHRRVLKEPKLNLSLVKMIIVIISCFVLTHIPFLAVNVIDPNLTLSGETAYVVMAYIALSHTAINPVVYALMNKQICMNTCKPAFCRDVSPSEIASL